MSITFSIYARTAGYRPDYVPVVRDCQFTTTPGELVLLTGRNGCGKSTLLRALGGDPQTFFDGTILANARAVRRLASEWQRLRVMWVPQDGACFEELSVRENLTMTSAWAAAPSIAPAVDMFPDLPRLLERRAMYLSGGERRMVELSAAALLAEPSLLIFDEPTAGLSADNSARFVAFIIQRLQQGTSILATTHQSALSELPHRVVELRSA